MNPGHSSTGVAMKGHFCGVLVTAFIFTLMLTVVLLQESVGDRGLHMPWARLLILSKLLLLVI
jgi:hypothetical protein